MEKFTKEQQELIKELLELHTKCCKGFNPEAFKRHKEIISIIYGTENN